MLNKIGVNISEEKIMQLLTNIKEYSVKKRGPLTIDEFKNLLEKVTQ
jgi:hypothetical protein